MLDQQIRTVYVWNLSVCFLISKAHYQVQIRPPCLWMQLDRPKTNQSNETCETLVLMKMPKTCPLLDEWIERIVIGPSRAKYAVILSELEWAQIVMPEQI